MDECDTVKRAAAAAAAAGRELNAATRRAVESMEKSLLEPTPENRQATVEALEAAMSTPNPFMVYLMEQEKASEHGQETEATFKATSIFVGRAT